MYPGTLTHLKLELPLGICPGLSKYTGHSSLEFVPSKTSHIQTDCILPIISGFKRLATYFQGAYVKYPLPTEWGTCAMATGRSEKMGGPHVEDSLSPWSWTDPPSSSRLCPFCNKSHNSRDSLMKHTGFHYRMVLVCPICGGCGSNQWRIVKGHIKKCAIARPKVVDQDVNPGEPHWKKSNRPLKHHTRGKKTEATYTLSTWPDPPNDEDPTDWDQIFKCIQEEWTVQIKHMRRSCF